MNNLDKLVQELKDIIKELEEIALNSENINDDLKRARFLIASNESNMDLLKASIEKTETDVNNLEELLRNTIANAQNLRSVIKDKQRM